MSARELRELALACLCHAAVRLMLRTSGFQTALGACRRPRPPCRHPLSFSRLQRLAAHSRRICAGSCLTETLVLGWLARRHGHADVALTIGVSLAGGVFRAHAWAGGLPEPAGFVPLWIDRRPGGDIDATQSPASIDR